MYAAEVPKHLCSHVAPDLFRIESFTFFSDSLHCLAAPQPSLVQTRGNVAPQSAASAHLAYIDGRAALGSPDSSPRRGDYESRRTGSEVQRSWLPCWAGGPGRATYSCSLTRSQGVLRRVQPRARRAEGLVRHPSHCRMSWSQSGWGPRASPRADHGPSLSQSHSGTDSDEWQARGY